MFGISQLPCFESLHVWYLLATMSNGIRNNSSCMVGRTQSLMAFRSKYLIDTWQQKAFSCDKIIFFRMGRAVKVGFSWHRFEAWWCQYKQMRMIWRNAHWNSRRPGEDCAFSSLCENTFLQPQNISDARFLGMPSRLPDGSQAPMPEVLLGQKVEN